MSDCMSRFRRSELTAWLLIVAAYAHISLGIISASHHAHMVTTPLAQWAALCTQFGVQRVQLPDSDNDTPSATTQVIQCPVCTVASMATPPSLHAPHAIFRHEMVVFLSPITEASYAPNAPPALRPPTRAPPAIA